MQSEENILQSMDTFFRYFAKYTKSILDFLGKYVSPYLKEIINLFKQTSNMLPNDDISYVGILVVILAIGVFLNYFFEEED
ncbi:MAG: hypothetical protein J7L47_06775 [Candidatus Odinarchaeota archaeon]|nr:hypothetical protein [Candidatus Odinarchaeota archaeon]